MFYCDGKYYFMWSENDTRSPEYRVRYAISNSPVRLDNPISETIVLCKDPDKQIYGTGHHAVINKPGTDEWYIVYHRFERPTALNTAGMPATTAKSASTECTTTPTAQSKR